MKIMATSELLLKKFYEELLSYDSSKTLTVNINLSKYVDELEVTENQINICLYYLQDAGYIKWNVHNSNTEQSITITAKGIQHVESQMK